MAFLILVIPVIVGIFSLSNSNGDKGVMAVNETEQIENNAGEKIL